VVHEKAQHHDGAVLGAALNNRETDLLINHNVGSFANRF